MAKIVKDVQEPYYGFLKNGQKVIEGRVFKPYDKDSIWSNRLIGKKIFFSNKKDNKALGYEEFEVEVKRVNWYYGNSLEEAIRALLENEGIKKLLPNLRENETEKAVRIYMDINREYLDDLAKLKLDNVLHKIGAFYVVKM